MYLHSVELNEVAVAENVILSYWYERTWAVIALIDSIKVRYIRFWQL